MRCIYCKQPSETSRSIEHVIPESLGNDHVILPAGAVCDICNNYFSRKVEAPFLNAPLLQLLRFEQALPSKKGRVPPMAVISPQLGRGEIRRDRDGDPRTIAFESDQLLDWSTRSRQPFVTYTPMVPPSDSVTSRFLAKVAIGYIAHLLVGAGNGTETIVDDEGLDRVRCHARRGTDPDWPIKVRAIYSPDRQWPDPAGSSQIVTEVDLLEHDDDAFLVFAVFGTELTIPLIAPRIDGYERWLRLNDDAIPLYPGDSAADLGWTTEPSRPYPREGWALPGP
jgi:hypothetical protein